MTEPATPYTAGKSATPESSVALRARIPGWGVDLDPKDRPSFPREQLGIATGAHWKFPDRQPETQPRERSIEHAMLPPVFGTSVPLKGASGAIRRYAYRKYSEGRAAHWLLLIAADRVDAWESHLKSFATLRPDNPVTETGIGSEFSGNGFKSRTGKRVDVNHSWMDPVIVAGPWVLAGLAAVGVLRALRGRR
jgi:hypothetical protein